MTDQADNALLKRLKEYKEFIAILVAAAGGFFWFNSFVAKSADVAAVEARMENLAHQKAVERIECLLKSYMALTQRQIRLAELNSDLSTHVRLMDRLEVDMKLQADPTLRQTGMNQLEQSKEEVILIGTVIRDESGKIQDIRDALGRQECGV